MTIDPETGKELKLVGSRLLDVKGNHVIYKKDFLPDQDSFFAALVKLDWVQRGEPDARVPRKEYFASDIGEPYTYGEGDYARTYHPQPWTEVLREIQREVQDALGFQFELCFLNYYETGKDSLNWHSDDSPEMDDLRPIAIVTFGAEREIWFRPREDKGGNPKLVTKQILHNGSLAMMLPGMQDTHQHKIPRSGLHNCGPRISLTFRGYADVR
jgi:alkylated DNA repair dioxygenase AlkB